MCSSDESLQEKKILLAELTVVCGCTFILWQVSLIDGFLDLVVGPFGIQIHGPAEVHQGQVSLTELLIHLRDTSRHRLHREGPVPVSTGLRPPADVPYLSYKKVNQRLFGNDLLQLLQLLKRCLTKPNTKRILSPGDAVTQFLLLSLMI